MKTRILPTGVKVTRTRKNGVVTITVDDKPTKKKSFTHIFFKILCLALFTLAMGGALTILVHLVSQQSLLTLAIISPLLFFIITIMTFAFKGMYRFYQYG
tara:strand:+ start:126 stop:425 length:300 start_codon:yes stop_codon:yes gene_type:complete